MTDPDEMLALNQLTGLVHQYEGLGPGGVGHETTEAGIGLLTCGCEGFEEVAEENPERLVMIRRKHLDRGIWKPAPCLQEDA